MYMCEDYNSPQSVYWSLKALIVLSLSDADEFWSTTEEAYPPLSGPILVPSPRQLICNHPEGNHHFMLSPAQFVAWPMKATQAKYCKFAYSSSFPFSVPTGPLIQQIAPDNTLALSRDGCETWAVKWKCREAVFSTLKLSTAGGTEDVAAATVQWYPWGDEAVQVDTTLIPVTDCWPDWHIRIHKIRVLTSIPTLHTVEGGFACPGRRKSDGGALPLTSTLTDRVALGDSELILPEDSALLILSHAGGSGIVAQRPHVSELAVSCSPLKPDSNTNLAYQRSLIPVVMHDMARRLEPGFEIVLATYVFAVSATANGRTSGNPSISRRWASRPNIVDIKDGKFIRFSNA